MGPGLAKCGGAPRLPLALIRDSLIRGNTVSRLACTQGSMLPYWRSLPLIEIHCYPTPGATPLLTLLDANCSSLGVLRTFCGLKERHPRVEQPRRAGGSATSK